MTQKIVEFEKWCNKCKYEDISELDDPCFDCISEPVNEDSRKPVKFEEKKEVK